MSRDARTSRLQQQIDANLKKAYEEVLREDIPDRFTELLSKLRESEAASEDRKAEAEASNEQ